MEFLWLSASLGTTHREAVYLGRVGGLSAILLSPRTRVPRRFGDSGRFYPRELTFLRPVSDFCAAAHGAHGRRSMVHAL